MVLISNHPLRLVLEAYTRASKQQQAVYDSIGAGAAPSAPPVPW